MYTSQQQAQYPPHSGLHPGPSFCMHAQVWVCWSDAEIVIANEASSQLRSLPRTAAIAYTHMCAANTLQEVE